MTATAGRTALFPIGPTAPLSFAKGSPERERTAAALATVRAADYDVVRLTWRQLTDKPARCATAVQEALTNASRP